MNRYTIVCLAIALASLVAVTGPAAAEARVTVSQDEVSFSFFNPCTSENVNFSGTALAVIDVTPDNHFVIHFVDINMIGIGETTGMRYRELFTFTEQRQGSDQNGPFAETLSTHTRIVTAGPGNDFEAEIVFHMTINANGELVVQFNRLNEGSCV